MMVKSLFWLINECVHIIQTVYFTSRRQCGSQFQSFLVQLFVSFSAICVLIPCWEFLIVRVINFLQTFEKNSLFAAYKTALIES